MEQRLQCAARTAFKFPKPTDHVFSYGTAGFRCRADLLESVLYRMGLLATLRSKATKATIGVMITASHNPEEDNGVKLVEPMGEMLVGHWEAYATELANAPDTEVGKVLRDIIKKESIDLDQQPNVFLARDTRPSSCNLSQALQDGVLAFGGQYTDYGILTTPQLHYMVRCHNTQEAYGQPTEQGYYAKFAKAFLKLKELTSMSGDTAYSSSLTLDGANGVGALKMYQLQSYMGSSLNITIVNDGSHGKLNYECGADYVKVNQKPPTGLVPEPGTKCVAVDGDADRIVYFFVDNAGKFHLLDGDKIATLFASYVQQLLSGSGLQLKLGLVQTAYANGSSTKYATETFKVPVACTKTGVKHLHHKATEFDIGVYFEANGHGTVLYSENAERCITEAMNNESLSAEQTHATQCLRCLVDLTNQTVGDAIADLLLVEAILCAKGWNIKTWSESYTDLPNRLLKVKVKDRTVIQTTDAERKVTTPLKLQPAIDLVVSKFQQGRSFVRPSGTEDVVRVYAEAESRASADQLAYEVALKVYELAGGVGEEPTLPN